MTHYDAATAHICHESCCNSAYVTIHTLQHRISHCTRNMFKYMRCCNLSIVTYVRLQQNSWQTRSVAAAHISYDVATCQSWHIYCCNRICGRYALLQQHISQYTRDAVLWRGCCATLQCSLDWFEVEAPTQLSSTDTRECVLSHIDMRCCNNTHLCIHESQSFVVGAVPLCSVRSTGLR